MIYAFIFVGGWRLFEKNDPIAYEIAAAIGMEFIFTVIFEVTLALTYRINTLEKRLSVLEKQHKSESDTERGESN